MEQEGLWVHVKQLWQVARRHRRAFVLGALVIVAIDVLDMAPPLLGVRPFFNGLQGQVLRGVAVTWQVVLMAVGVILGSTVVMGVLRYAMSLTFSRLGLAVSVEMRRQLYIHLQTLEPKFYTETRIGDLMARMTNDLRAVRMAITRGGIMGVDFLVNALAVVPVLFWLDWKLALCSLAGMVPLPFFVKRIGDRLHASFQRVQEQMSNVSSNAQESITGVRVIKAYAQERNVEREFRESAREYLGRNLRFAWLQAIFESTIGLASGLSLVIVLGVGGWQVVRRFMGWGDFAAYLQVVMLIMWPMLAFGWVVTQVQQGSASLKRINELLAAEPEVRDTAETLQTKTAIEGEIEFRGLTFAFNGAPVLQDVTLRVPKGRTLAVVGEVGSGKSTLINMISRLVEPPDGTLFIDGVDVKRIPLATLRRAVAYVPQETFLFSSSIRDNIAFACPDADDETVAQAAEVSQISRDVGSFPNGYATLLGERGINLSGGQKQRVAIARAVLGNPAILILDDALSSVDTHTEEEILVRLRAVMRARTSILVSHRISTLKEADHIIVLERGRIVEQGTHEALVALDGLYAGIYRKQLLEEEIEEA